MLTSIIAFVLGISVGYLLFSNVLINENSLLTSILGNYSDLATIGRFIVLIFRLISDFLKDNVFEYDGFYKKQEDRVIFHRKGFSMEEKERHKETGYYLRVSKKRGNGGLKIAKV